MITRILSEDNVSKVVRTTKNSLKAKLPAIWTIVLGCAVVALLMYIVWLDRWMPVVDANTFPAAALHEAAAIEEYVTTYGSGAKLANDAAEQHQRAQRMMLEASKAAHARDVYLCTTFRLRYDRIEKKLVQDQNCIADSQSRR